MREKENTGPVRLVLRSHVANPGSALLLPSVGPTMWRNHESRLNLCLPKPHHLPVAGSLKKCVHTWYSSA